MTGISTATMRQLVDATADAIEAHSGELTELDQKIGDGDHGTNLRRGFEALRASGEEIAALPFGAALQKAGLTLVMKVGGASGPLYGSLLMSMGQAASEPPASPAALADIFQAGIEAVKRRGKSDVGAKTMLDVLVPVAKTLRAHDGGDLAPIRSAADEAMAATRDMQATKGRASFLGERSIGHIDPGACSTALLIRTICDVLEEK
jgi:dihydroxyacetone kinase-like protein